MKFKGLTLDEFQEKAVKAIDDNQSVVVSAPTGSGKTLIADYIIDRDLKKGKKIIYTAPIKALSNQKFKDFSEDYGKENVGLMTGDIVKNPTAPLIIMTTEIYRNMCMTDDEMIQDVSYVIFDEIHFINDPERGYVWEESIIFSKPHVRMLCLSATIPNAQEFANWIEKIKEHKVTTIKHSIRPVPLSIDFYDYELGLTSLKEIHDMAQIPVRRKRGKKRRKAFAPNPVHTDLIKDIQDQLPCMFFTFSRHGCQRNAIELMKKNLFRPNPEIISAIRQGLKNAPTDINKLESTIILRQTLPQGIAFHHAGLLPVMKNLVEDLFGRGLIKVLYTTETFAVGINMPAKTVCFNSLRKFDGQNFRLLNSKEFFQIAGRAGRRGIDKEGFVHVMVARRDLEYEKMKRLTSSDTAPIRSQFRLSVNTVLNLIKRHSDAEIYHILDKSLYAFQQKKKTSKERMHHNFERIKRRLKKLDYITKSDELTDKGEFTTMIYADELIFGEVFATDFYERLNEYQMLLLFAVICYEGRERTMFYKLHPTKDSAELKGFIRKNEVLRRYKRFLDMDNVTAMIWPVQQGKSIFDVLDNTNLLEGDVIRFLRQILDRIGQVRQATRDKQLRDRLDSVQQKILNCLKEIDVL